MVCWEIKFENKSIQMLTTYCCFILFKSNGNPNFPQWRNAMFKNFHKIGYFKFQKMHLEQKKLPIYLLFKILFYATMSLSIL